MTSINKMKPDKEILLSLVNVRMPFGKYKGQILADLPISYLEWFVRKGGFPQGKLGMQMATVYEIKQNGLQDILTQIKAFHKHGEAGRSS